MRSNIIGCYLSLGAGVWDEAAPGGPPAVQSLHGGGLRPGGPERYCSGNRGAVKGRACSADSQTEDQRLERMKRHLYDNELRCANKLVGLFRHDPVARAYFQGGDGLARLASSVVRKLNIAFAGLHRLRKGDTLCHRLRGLGGSRHNIVN